MQFSIGIEYGWQLYLEQGGRCALSGIPIYFTLPGAQQSAHQKQFGANTASLDRINSSGNYTEGNVQWVHKNVNAMKLAYDQNYFIDMCKSISLTHGHSDESHDLLLPVNFEIIEC